MIRVDFTQTMLSKMPKYRIFWPSKIGAVVGEEEKIEKASLTLKLGQTPLYG